MMMKYLIPLLMAAPLAIDYLFWRSRHAHLGPRLRRVIYGAILAGALLPLLSLLEASLRTDNLPEEMLLRGSWCLMIYLAMQVRFLLYLGWLFRHKAPRIASVVVACGVLFALIHGVAVGRTALRVEEVTIRSSRLPVGWQGARLLHFSDLHVGSLLRPVEECRRLVDTILALQPELILFTGDLVNIRHTELTREVMDELSRLKAPLGVYAVTGNHDLGFYIKDSLRLPREENTRLVIEKERQMGWQLLENEHRLLIRHHDTISLTGIGFERSLRNLRHTRELPATYQPQALYDTLSPHWFNLTLCHLPQPWDDIRTSGYGDLTLSGHVHSMQHKLPLGARGWSLASLLYTRWSGLYTQEGRHLYINDGVGSVGIPARIGATPELTLITLEQE